MKKVALVPATLIAALGLTSPAGADGWGGNPPPGFPAPPPVSLFMGNGPAFAPTPPRRTPPQRAYGYGPAYAYAPGYGYPRYGRSHRGGGGRTLIIVTR